MSHYYAGFLNIGNDCFRWDTRIYLNKGAYTQHQGTCVGAVVAKNPGSAVAGGSTWGPLQIGRDRLLPDVRRIFTEAYSHLNYTARTNTCARVGDEYVQVLNLFYLREPILSQALTKIQPYKQPGVWFRVQYLSFSVVSVG